MDGIGPILRVSVEGVRSQLCLHLGSMAQEMNDQIAFQVTPERVALVLKEEIDRQLPKIVEDAVRSMLSSAVWDAMNSGGVRAAVRASLEAAP